MLISHNLSLQEQVDYTISKTLPIIAGTDLYRSTGESEEKHWSGPWKEIKALYDALEYSTLRRLRATLKRSADGNFGELTATWSMYVKGDGQTDPGGGGGGSGEKKQPGESRDVPEYVLQLQTVQEPILTHYKWNVLNEDGLLALKMLMDGYKRDEPMQLKDGSKVTVGAVVDAISPPELVDKVLQGVTSYNSPHIVLTVRYKSAEIPSISTVGTIVSSVPGGFAAPEGRDWYFHGPSWTMKGSELWVTEVYELSGPGGWDKFIYGE